MTALKKYQKLESPGLWRDRPEAQRREVVVAFGDASLVLSDPRTGSALSHWSLPAISRLNPGALPAIYAPDTETEAETLEIEDATMIGAIETVRGAIAGARSRPGRLRGLVLGSGAIVIGLLAIFWLPQALITQTAALVPESKRAEIGRMALADVTRVTGMPCATPLGLRAEGKLAERVLGPGKGQILLMRDGVHPAAHLPGGFILLSRELVEVQDGPQVAAGFALAEYLRSQNADPLVPILRHAGLIATLRLLTTGTLPAGSVAGYGEKLLATPPEPLSDSDVLIAFTGAMLASSPYAYALDPSGETTLGLIEADPFRAETAPPILPDGDWISLQAICQAEAG
ncbi:MAG: hypothetical protein DI533_17680 [Cereibacter sphaeroides]|uniref:Uncharacterized protein n=1 Tax=Cereibacter sphaeroides TaxID=1063 RepID=A0A2W5S2T9_CERSP|nr:MAG: hypothetical protein DI533_17680 [Cereibacter sphaeroides]